MRCDQSRPVNGDTSLKGPMTFFGYLVGSLDFNFSEMDFWEMDVPLDPPKNTVSTHLQRGRSNRPDCRWRNLVSKSQVPMPLARRVETRLLTRTPRGW